GKPYGLASARMVRRPSPAEQAVVLSLIEEAKNKGKTGLFPDVGLAESGEPGPPNAGGVGPGDEEPAEGQAELQRVEDTRSLEAPRSFDAGLHPHEAQQPNGHDEAHTPNGEVLHDRDGEPTTPLEIARAYIKRGWAVVPIPHKAKGPSSPEWGKRDI